MGGALRRPSLPIYSLPSEELDVAALRAATSNSWFLISNFIAGRE